MKKIMAIVIAVVVVIALCFVGVTLWKHFFTEKAQTVYSTQKSVMTDLRRTIASTGTVEPEELVNVGAQIGGMVLLFGKDSKGKTVDYGSEVKAGEVLARIDDSLYAAERDIAKANLEQSEASIASSQANLDQADAKYELAKADWDRAQRLHPQGIISKSDYDTAQSAFHAAKAAQALAKAGLAESRAKLGASKATLSKAERNLGYCVITSPVDGVIIDRRVNIGQTVNASMNAPSLFLIAKDLRRMQVWVSVNEADVGEIRAGVKAEFTVDAFPNRVFPGVVRKTRLNATMSQNVVTYVVEIDTDNADGTLLPYLTANVKFILEERTGVIAVPNAAFRFVPQGMAIPEVEQGKKLLWIQEGNTIRPVAVRTGMNDGIRTEILEGEIPEGADIVTGSRTMTKKELAQDGPESRNAASSNPFLPKMPQRPGAKKSK